ncbi:MAG: ester cyclase [Deltaproteobacteria bacterium]|nr:ester cyclase [Deltaproteobacteria bacterium]
MATLSKPEITKASTTDIASIARSLYDNFNQRDLDKAVSIIATECEFQEMPTGQKFRGPEGVRQDLQMWLKAFPDGKCNITNVIANGDLVAVEFTGVGTQNGPLTGPDGKEIAATGRRAEIPFCDVHQIRNGKVVRVRSYYDQGSMMRQLGLMK